MTKLILLALAVAACSTTATIADGTCGNYVLDPGEDCDQPGANCTADCRIVCDPTMRGTVCAGSNDGTCCPTGFTCGVDDVCHAPGGTLSTVGISQPFDVAQFRVADLDGDLIDDVLGVSSSAVSAIYGDLISPLTNANTQSSPFSTGPIAIGDYTGDQRPDVVIPTAAGLYALETSSGVPQPVAFPAFVYTTAVAARVATLGGDRAVALSFDVATANAVLSADAMTPVPLCGQAGIQLGNIAGRGLTADTESINTVGTPLRVPLETETSMGLVVCIQTPASLLSIPSYEYMATSVIGTGGGNRLTPDPFAGMAIPAYGETFFAHLDNDPSPCPDLAVPVIDNTNGNNDPFGAGLNATVVVPGKANAIGLGCTLNPVTAASSLKVAGVPLASITITHLGKTFSALVTESGIYDVNVGTGANVTSPVIPATRGWRYAIVADLDGNGLPDLVTVGAAADVEVIFQQPAVLGESQWIQRRITTTGAVSLVTAGDYDGDGFTDLAFAVVDPSDSRSGAIAVAWGGTDGFADPQISVTLDEFFSMTTAQIPDPSQPVGFDHADDLIVAHGALAGITTPYAIDPADPSQATYIYGSSTRLLSSPFRVKQGAVVAGDPGVLAAIGNYGPGGALGVLGVFSVPQLGNAAGEYEAEQLGPEPYGDFTQTAGVLFDVCGQQPACVQSAKLFNIALGATGELLLALRGDHVYGGKNSPAGTDVGADEPYCGSYYLATSGSTPSWSLTKCHDLVGDPQGAVDLTTSPWSSVYEVASSKVLTNDGMTALIVLSKLNTAKAYEAVLWNLTMVNGAPLLSSPVALSMELGTTLGIENVNCYDATSIELGQYTDASGAVFGADGPDMVVACRAPSTLSGTGFSMQLFMRFTNASGVAYVPAIDTGQDTTIELHAGDLNGDGLDDVVYTVGSTQQGTIHLFTQCDSHGAGCDRSGGSR